MKPLMTLLLLALFAAAPAMAGDLNPAHIKADAKWFGHVDLAAMRDIPMIQQKMQQHQAHREAKGKGESKGWADKMGFDPMTDLQGVTLYSNQYDGYDAVLLVYVTKLDREKMLASFKEKHPDHTTEKVGNRTIYNWQGKHHGKEMPMTGVIVSDQLFIVGSGNALVKDTLAAIDGKGDSMKPGAPLLAGLSDDMVFASRALDVPGEYQATTRCPVLRACGEAFVQWTESDGDVTANYQLSANDAQTAMQIKQIVAGMIAMMQFKSKPGSAGKAVADDVKYEANGTQFSLNLETTTEELEAAMKEMKKHKMRGHGKHHGHHKGGHGDKGHMCKCGHDKADCKCSDKAGHHAKGANGEACHCTTGDDKSDDHAEKGEQKK